MTVPMTPEQLRRAKVITGASNQAIANEGERSGDSIRLYLNGRLPVPEDVWLGVRRLLERRAQEIAQLLREID